MSRSYLSMPFHKSMIFICLMLIGSFGIAVYKNAAQTICIVNQLDPEFASEASNSLIYRHILETCPRIEAVPPESYGNATDVPIPVTSYDMTFITPSLLQMGSHGWPLLQHRNFDSTLLKKINRIISFMGGFNVGKTTFINMLTGRNYMSGYTTHTRGINALIWNQFFFLDTEGTHAAINNVVSHVADTMIRTIGHLTGVLLDRERTASFVQHIHKAMADGIVFVLGDLNDQDHKDLFELAHTLPLGKKLFVVHNLKHLETIAEVERAANRDIWQGFPSVQPEDFDESKLGVARVFTHTHEHVSGGFVEVKHFVLAKEGSEAGNLWNEFTLREFEEAIMGVRHGPVNDFASYINNTANFHIKDYFKTAHRMTFMDSASKSSPHNMLTSESVGFERAHKVQEIASSSLLKSAWIGIKSLFIGGQGEEVETESTVDTDKEATPPPTIEVVYQNCSDLTTNSTMVRDYPEMICAKEFVIPGNLNLTYLDPTLSSSLGVRLDKDDTAEVEVEIDEAASTCALHIAVPGSTHFHTSLDRKGSGYMVSWTNRKNERKSKFIIVDPSQCLQPSCHTTYTNGILSVHNSASGTHSALNADGIRVCEHLTKQSV